MRPDEEMFVVGNDCREGYLGEMPCSVDWLTPAEKTAGLGWIKQSNKNKARRRLRNRPRGFWEILGLQGNVMTRCQPLLVCLFSPRPSGRHGIGSHSPQLV